MTNTTIEGNAARSGGGLSNNTFDVRLVHVTIANNKGLPAGGGLLQFGVSSETTFRNTIIANNTPGNCEKFSFEIISLGNNIADDDTCALNAAKDNVDPLLAVLADNGRPTRTLALKAGSPAIDAGADAGLKVDQRGVARPQRKGFDIGAFELQRRARTALADDAAAGAAAAATAACDLDRNGRIDFADLDRLIAGFPVAGGRDRGGDADATLKRCVSRCTHPGCPSRALIERPRRPAG